MKVLHNAHGGLAHNYYTVCSLRHTFMVSLLVLVILYYLQPIWLSIPQYSSRCHASVFFVHREGSKISSHVWLILNLQL